MKFNDFVELNVELNNEKDYLKVRGGACTEWYTWECSEPDTEADAGPCAGTGFEQNESSKFMNGDLIYY